MGKSPKGKKPVEDLSTLSKAELIKRMQGASPELYSELSKIYRAKQDAETHSNYRSARIIRSARGTVLYS